MKIGFFGLLALVFIVLKLTVAIAWPWLWVLSPIWISIILGACLWAAFIWWASK